MNIDIGKIWFMKSKTVIEEAFGEDYDMFCRLLAATSPVTDIRTNVQLAIKAYRQLNWYSELRGGFTGVHHACILKFMSGDIDNEDFYSPARDTYPKGRKIWSLYQNLIGNEWFCAIDRWMLRYFGFDGDTRITAMLYDKLESRIFELAMQHGVTPAIMQAQLWCDARGYLESYGDVIKRKEINRDNILRRLL